jgi:hypothetical protein
MIRKANFPIYKYFCFMYHFDQKIQIKTNEKHYRYKI